VYSVYTGCRCTRAHAVVEGCTSINNKLYLSVTRPRVMSI